jgi:hypothetical protein
MADTKPEKGKKDKDKKSVFLPLHSLLTLQRIKRKRLEKIRVRKSLNQKLRKLRNPPRKYSWNKYWSFSIKP